MNIINTENRVLVPVLEFNTFIQKTFSFISGNFLFLKGIANNLCEIISYDVDIETHNEYKIIKIISEKTHFIPTSSIEYLVNLNDFYCSNLCYSFLENYHGDIFDQEELNKLYYSLYKVEISNKLEPGKEIEIVFENEITRSINILKNSFEAYLCKKIPYLKDKKICDISWDKTNIIRICYVDSNESSDIENSKYIYSDFRLFDEKYSILKSLENDFVNSSSEGSYYRFLEFFIPEESDTTESNVKIIINSLNDKKIKTIYDKFKFTFGEILKETKRLGLNDDTVLSGMQRLVEQGEIIKSNDDNYQLAR